MNKYTYEVITCNGLPLHFVYCVTSSYDGLHIYSTKGEADAQIDFIKRFYGCKYDYNLTIPTSIVREYKNNEHLWSNTLNKEVYCGY